MSSYERPYHGQSVHTVSLFDTDWELPLVKIDQETYIASDAQLVLGQTEFIEQAAGELASRLAGAAVPYLVAPEAKALPLVQSLAQNLGVEYAVVRKHVKGYMRDPFVTTVDAITTSGEQQLVVDGPVAAALRNTRVCVVDDVVSTGGTMAALESLLTDLDATVTAKAAIFEEGRPHPEVETLGALPVFKLTET